LKTQTYEAAERINLDPQKSKYKRTKTQTHKKEQETPEIMAREGTRSQTGHSKPRVFPVVDTAPATTRKRTTKPKTKKKATTTTKAAKPAGVTKKKAPVKKKEGVAKKVKAAVKKVEKKVEPKTEDKKDAKPKTKKKESAK